MRSPYRNVEVVVPRDHLTQEPQLVPLLFMHAKSAWNTSGHPGWGLYKHLDATTTQMPGSDTPQYGVNSQQVPCFTPSEYAGDAVRAAVGGPAAGSTGAGKQGATSEAAPPPTQAKPAASGGSDVVMSVLTDGKRSSSPGSGGRRSPEIDAQRRRQLQSIFNSGESMRDGGATAAAAAAAPAATAAGLSSLALSAGDIPWSQLSLPVDFPAAPPLGTNWMDTNAIAAHTPAMPGPFGASAGGVVAGMFAGATVPPLFGGPSAGGARDEGGDGGLVRLRSSLGSAALDVARPERQRLRADEQQHGVEVR